VSRRRIPDVVLLAVFVPLWALCFTLQAREMRNGHLAWIPLTVSAAPGSEGFPTISSFWPDAEAETSELRGGDRIARVGRLGLAGAGPFRFAASVYEAMGPEFAVDARVIRAGKIEELTFKLRPVEMSWRLPLLSLGFAVPAFLVLWLRSGSRSARAFFASSLCFSLQTTFFFGGPPLQTYLWIVVYALSACMIYPLMFRAVLAVPEGLHRGSPWGSAWIALFSLCGLGGTSWLFGVPFSSEVGVRATAGANALAPLLTLFLLTRNYVRATPIGRRQLRWIVYGLYIGALPVGVGSLVSVLTPRLWWIHEILMISPVLVPFCFLIAIVRFNFLDVDRLISVTLSYNILLVLLVGVGVLAVPRAGEAASGALGVDPRAGQVALVLVLGATVVPAHRRLRPRIDRMLFAERYGVEQGIEELIGELPGCETTEELSERVGTTLSRLMRSEHCVLYVRRDHAYSAVFAESVENRELPPSCDEKSAPVIALLGRRTPLVFEQAGRASGANVAAPTFPGAAIVLGLRRGEELLGFMSLGPKRSGDVYTATDLGMLTDLADSLAYEWSQVEPC
jgi:hypothetical protein